MALAVEVLREGEGTVVSGGACCRWRREGGEREKGGHQRGKREEGTTDEK